MYEQTLPQALATVKFVVNQRGETKGVFLPLAAWEAVVAALEDAEDLTVVQQYLSRRTTARSLEEMGLLRWEDVAAEWDDEDKVCLKSS
jgi:hypothetical protein